MDKKQQERMTNRVMLNMAIGFVACVAMYYIYGAIGNNIFNPTATFITIAAIFVILAGLMMFKGVKESKKLNLGIVDGYKENLKARLYFNFEIFFIAAAIISLVINFVGAAWKKAGIHPMTESATVASGYADIMAIIAIAIAVYIVALIAWTFIYQAMQKNKAKQARISKKATAKAALKAKRSKLQ